jgi:hypothetical protein
VLQGTFGVAGITQPFAFRGPMNLAIWTSVATALTTTAGSIAASVASAAGLANGSAIKSVNVPPGTIVSGLSGTNLNLLLPPGFKTAAITVTGADAAASFTDAALKWDATVQVERSFDGGYTWLVCNAGGTGTLAQYIDLSSVSLTFGEPERNVLYRLNCIEWTAGLINYRISQTGGAAESLAIGPLSGG